MQAAQADIPHGVFMVKRRIGFGECDAARIYRTPRAIDIAVEAVDAWLLDALNISSYSLISDYNLVLDFTRIACEYLRPVTASQVVQVHVHVVGIDDNAVTFRATAGITAEHPCFRVTLSACFTSVQTSEMVTIPGEFYQVIKQFQPAGAVQLQEYSGGHHAVRNAEYQEQNRVERCSCEILQQSEAPFVQRHRILFGECGPSGRVYPPRVYDLALEAVGEWYERTIGLTWLQQCIELRGQPFVDINCLYLRPMVPDSRLNIAVTVRHLGAASIIYSVVGYDDDGLPSFDAQLAACYIDETSGVYKPTPFPEEYRRRIQEYQSRCCKAG